MMTKRGFVLLLALLVTPSLVCAQQKRGYPPAMPGAKVETYKVVKGVHLKLWIYDPPGHTAKNRSPAIVFFFGGGWRSGTPEQFLRQCRYLASRGMVAMAADYRVSSRNGVKAVSCVEDGKSAIRWVRKNAARLGVDPNRIAAGGGSAGGHIAAAVATISQFNDPGDDLSVSCVPNALVLFNPALDLTGKRLASFKERLGAEPAELSPASHVKKGDPPTIIFHGKADTTVPYSTAEGFCERMHMAGNRCELVGYDGANHGFFNYGRGDGTAYYDTLRRADEFLESLGWLKGPPTLKAPPPKAKRSSR